MTSDEIAELAAGYALGGLEAGERERFEALLRTGDPDAAAALADCEATLAALAADAAVAPPPRVREAVLARLGEPWPPAAAAPRSPRRRSRWISVWTGAAAAGIVAVVVGLAVSDRYERRLDALAREAAALRAEVDRLQRDLGDEQRLAALVRDPGTRVVALAGQPPAPEGRGRMLWNPRHGGWLLAAGLPALPPGRTYQLWAIAGTAAPVPAGVFGVGAGGAASLRVPPLTGVDTVDVFAVTLEPEGGRPAPTGPMVLAGKS